MKCEIAATDLLLLAAGELDDATALELARHAAACERCSGRLSSAGALLRSHTGLDVARPVAPPPRTKARLLARVAATRPRSPARWVSLAAASLVGALLGGAVSAWVAERNFGPREDLLRFELALVQDSHRKQREHLDELRTRLEGVERGAQLASFAATIGRVGTPSSAEPGDAWDRAEIIGPGWERDQAWRSFLQGTGQMRPTGPRTIDTRAQVFCLENEGLCVLRAAGLPAPRAGESYALWLTNVVGRYYLVGTFEVDANGEASLLASAPVDVRDVARSVVTLEPGEAGWRPAGSVVLLDETNVN